MKNAAFVIIFGICLAVIFGISGMFSSVDLSAGGPEEGSQRDVRKRRNPNDWPKIDGRLDRIFWVVQISDIHLSVFNDAARGPDLLDLCENYIRRIDPKAVIVTGDLTDAKLNGKLDSKQIYDEWIIYRNIMQKCSAMFKGRWIDVRGNHDCFDVYNSSSSNNYFRSFSATGPVYDKDKIYEKGYIHNVDLLFGSYSFIGMDTCSRPGPNRPFNFFGYLGQEQAKYLRFLSSVTTVSNHTVWFGHFPTSVIVQDPPVLRDIMSGSILYICGHLHTLGNQVRQMYARHKSGQLELELGDWKDNRMFRIIAFDNDLVSFADARFDQDPIVIVTNPKNSQHLSPMLEPVEMIASSTHIRMLLFTKKAIKQVTVHISHKFIGFATPVSPDSPLYVLKWDPSTLAHKSHKLLVTIFTDDKKTTMYHHHFSIDGQVTEFGFVPRFLLMMDIYTLGKVTFNLMILIYVLVQVFLRQCSNIRAYYFYRGLSIFRTVNSLLMKTWLVARTDRTFYTLVSSVVYMAFGPWFVGYLLNDRIGIVFAWGILIGNKFLPGGLPYFYGIFQLLIFTAPVTLICGHILDLRRKNGYDFRLSGHPIFIFGIVLQFLITAYLAFGEFRWAYGWLAVLLGPLRTGNLLLFPLFLWMVLKTDVRDIMAEGGHF